MGCGAHKPLTPTLSRKREREHAEFVARVPSYNNLRPAVVERHDVALDNAGAKADEAVIVPHFGADGLAREHRRGKASLDCRQPRWIVAAQTLEDRVTGEPEGREPVEDRSRKPGRLGDSGVD